MSPPAQSTSPLDVPSARRASLGPTVADLVAKSRVLLIGAGGIGCELLKNLVLTGFPYIEVIDLDTIDVSNLNRQFLFRGHHVGQPKAVVAREVVLGFAASSSTQIVAHHDNIKDPRFGLKYFESFDLVLNALDNVDARRHVNRMCLATNRPLIDAGTTGYVGQVNVIRKGVTQCYECEPKATQKVYPICTIRSTPDKPVHCIVWAKEAFKLLFGQPQSSMLFEAPDAPEPSVYMDAVLATPKGEAGEKEVVAYGDRIMRALFHEDVRRRLDAGVYKAAAKVPTPLNLDQDGHAYQDLTQAPSRIKQQGWDQKVWSQTDCLREFLAALVVMHTDAERKSQLGSVDFDKDDAVAMRFVTAAANLRAMCFHIPTQSLHDAKGIAGNIIPAIATTNAIVAGLQVLEALRILQGQADQCRYTYVCRAKTRNNMLLQPTRLSPPSSECFVCNKSSVDLHINTATTQLSTLLEKVIKGRLSFVNPSIYQGDNVLYEEGDDADEVLHSPERLAIFLNKLPGGGIKDQTTIEVDDLMQDLRLTIHVYHRDHFEEEEVPEGFLIMGQGKLPPAPAPTAPAPAPSDGPSGQRQEVEEDVVVMEGGHTNGNAVASTGKGKNKRPREEEQEEGQGNGKQKAANGGDEGAKKARLINLADNDHDDELIVIDD